MSEKQCWSVQANGSRCPGPAQPGAFFCSRHRHVRAAEVSRIWRAPEAEMPPELVAAMRRYAPEVTFPAPEPAPANDAAPSARGPGKQHSGHPVSTPGGGGARGPSDRTDRTDRTDASSAAPSLAEAGPTPPASLLPGETAGSPQLDWLLATLQEAMEGVMAGDASPLQKANAVARLAGHYLKAYRAKELERENKALIRRLAAAEAQVAELEQRLAAAERPREAHAEPPARRDMTRPEPAGSPASPEREEANSSLSLREERVITLDAGECTAAGLSRIEPAPLTAGATDGARDPP